MAIGRFRHDALSEVYRRHAPAAFGLARRIVGDRALAEEVVQEVFLRLWNQPDRFDAARGSLRTYLLTQTHGRSVDVIRAEPLGGRAKSATRDDLREQLRPRARGMGSHPGGARTRRGRAPERGRAAAIELAYFGGHTYREVAVVLGEPEGTVKSRIRSGLSRLRDALVESGVAGPWHES